MQPFRSVWRRTVLAGHSSRSGGAPGRAHRSRRSMRVRGGAYIVLFAVVLVGLFGFGGLAIDGSRYRFAEIEAQDVADTAAHAAVLTLKRTGSRTEAEAAARMVTSLNRIGGAEAQFESITFGAWDEDARQFTSAETGTNAVYVEVGRTGDQSVGFTLARFIGHTNADVVQHAVAATRSLEVVLVIDITASWEQWNLVKAQEAAVAFLDVLHANHGDDDAIGMTVFMGPFGWEFTPFTNVDDSSRDYSLVRNDWDLINMASFAGEYRSDWATGSYATTKHVPCNVFNTNNQGGVPLAGYGACHGGAGGCFQPGWENDHDEGTCFSNMPRVYSDEFATDYTVGMEMAREMMQERNDSSTYRALVILTDGRPDTWNEDVPVARAADGYVETTFDYYERTTAPANRDAIATETIALSQELWDEMGTNIWFVSFRDEDCTSGYCFMADSAKGDGWYEFAETAGEIVTIFEDIAYQLPVAVVE